MIFKIHLSVAAFSQMAQLDPPSISQEISTLKSYRSLFGDATSEKEFLEFSEGSRQKQELYVEMISFLAQRPNRASTMRASTSIVEEKALVVHFFSLRLV